MATIVSSAVPYSSDSVPLLTNATAEVTQAENALQNTILFDTSGPLGPSSAHNPNNSLSLATLAGLAIILFVLFNK